MARSRSTITATKTVMRWYLSAGDEECPHCGQLYVYEMEFRCPDCDAPSCPHCKCQHPQDRFVCPDCAAPDRVALSREDAARGR